MQSSGSSIVMRILGQEAYLKCEIDFCFSRQCTRQFQIGLFFSLDWYLKIFLSCHSKMKSSQTISNFMWHRLCDVDFVTSTMWHRIRMVSFCFNNVEVLSHWQKRLFQPGIRGPLWYYLVNFSLIPVDPRFTFSTDKFLFCRPKVRPGPRFEFWTNPDLNFMSVYSWFHWYI